MRAALECPAPPPSARSASHRPGVREDPVPEQVLAGFPQFDALVQTHKLLRRGQTLYNAGARLESLYIVRCGWFKSMLPLESGTDQVIAFHWHGEMLGLDGIGSERHRTTAVAITDADVWVIPYRRIAGLCDRSEAAAAAMARLMSQEIVRTQSALLRVGTMNAEQRVLDFLAEVSAKLSKRGFSATRFLLPMTREQIGQYLGIQLETVSRVLGRLQQRGVIGVVGGKQVELRRPLILQAGVHAKGSWQ